MSLIGKFFKGGGDAKANTSEFAESQATHSIEQTKSRNAPRRDLVRLTLRETMRRHGIPSDWIECRTLSVLTRQHKSGMHVQFLVRQGDHQLLAWVHAFQESFWDQLMRTDPTARDWLFSVGWEFYGKSQQGYQVMPGPGTWQDTSPPEEDPREAGDTLPPDEADEHEALATDLQALHALVSAPAQLGAAAEVDGKPTRR